MDIREAYDLGLVAEPNASDDDIALGQALYDVCHGIAFDLRHEASIIEWH